MEISLDVQSGVVDNVEQPDVMHTNLTQCDGVGNDMEALDAVVESGADAPVGAVIGGVVPVCANRNESAGDEVEPNNAGDTGTAQEVESDSDECQDETTREPESNKAEERVRATRKNVINKLHRQSIHLPLHLVNSICKL